LYANVGLNLNDTEFVLYTQSGCADSRKVRTWLAANGISFTERDVTADPDAAGALAATGHFVTPLLVAGETKVVGFRPTVLATALNLGEGS
jgi:glutaredoxin